MSREITNELTWSVSRDRLFRTCKRAYYYHYYGSWGGWEKSAPKRVRRLYILKNMQNIWMWAGGIVHSTIAEALQSYLFSGRHVEKAAIIETARLKLRHGWREAIDKDWQLSPKKTNLFELYYGNGRNLPAKQTEQVKDRVYGCLSAFAESPILSRIHATEAGRCKSVDTLDSFSVDGDLKVWCAIDFAFTGSQGMLNVLDWKTGGEHPKELRTQLACYCLYAVTVWGVPLEKQRLAGVFLKDNARISNYPVSGKDLNDTRDLIFSGVEEMRSFLDGPEENRAREEDFPGCGDAPVCMKCNFRGICPEVADVSVGEKK